MLVDNQSELEPAWILISFGCYAPGWRFKWYCRRYCETWPVYNGTTGELIENMTTTCNELQRNYTLTDGKEDGGCFVGDGYLQSGNQFY